MKKFYLFLVTLILLGSFFSCDEKEKNEIIHSNDVHNATRIEVTNNNLNKKGGVLEAMRAVRFDRVKRK